MIYNIIIMNHTNKTLLILVFILLPNVYNAQSAPQSPIPGGQLIDSGTTYKPSSEVINPDAQLYLPETFSPTDTIPLPKDREELVDQQNKKVLVPPKRPTFWGGVTLGAQYGQFEQLPYSDIYISPYVILGPLFLMYEIPLRFSWNGVFITRMWTSPAALVSKIEADLYYEKTNHVFQHIQASIYRGEKLIQGHGRFFYDYNPNLYAPYEPFKTFKFSLDVSYFGINFLLANIAQPDLMAGEIYIKPLAGLKNFYKNLKIYGVLGVDLDPFQSFSPGLYLFAPNVLSPRFTMYEVGIDVPVYMTRNQIFGVSLYADYAQFLGASQDDFTIQNGSGVSGGVLMTLATKFSIQFEVSQAFNAWQPRWVNTFYYVDRPFVEFGTTERKNKYMTIIPNQMFYTGSVGYSWIEKAVSVQAEVFGDFSGNDMWFTLSFTLGNILLEKLSMSIYFTMRELTNPNRGSFLSPDNTIIDINLKYHMMKNMYWGILLKSSGRVAESFNNDQDPIIETVPFIFLGLDFSYRF